MKTLIEVERDILENRNREAQRIYVNMRSSISVEAIRAIACELIALCSIEESK